MPLMSYPRFTLTVFPLYVGLALSTRDRPRAHKVVVIVGLVLAGGVHRQVRGVQLGGLSAATPGAIGQATASGRPGRGRYLGGVAAGSVPGFGVTRLKTYTPSLA